MKRIRFKTRGGWGDWVDFDKAVFDDDVLALETNETITLDQLKEHYPDKYDELKSQLLKSGSGEGER